MSRVAHDQWKGVMHAVVTPFEADGVLDEEAFTSNINTYLDYGVSGIVLAGDNGEGWALSDDEKVRLTSLTHRLIADKHASAKLVVGTNAIPTASVVEATRRVADAGADAVLVGPATHLVVATPAELLQRYETVARQGSLPIVLYNNPRRTQVNLTPDMVDRLADIDEVIAIKDSGQDFSQFTATLRRTRDRINVMLGPCFLIFPAIPLGAAGYISSGPDLLGQAGVDYYSDLVNGRLDEAAPVHFQLQQISAAVNAAGTFPSGLKAAMDLVGMRGGYTRAPIATVTADARERLRRVLIEAGVLDTNGMPSHESADLVRG
jgi:4-hydroxy-tetrahydrodipicolinate synthase